MPGVAATAGHVLRGLVVPDDAPVLHRLAGREGEVHRDAAAPHHRVPRADRRRAGARPDGG